MSNAQTQRVRVVSKTFEALDICSYELVSESGAELPPFAAGAHLDVSMPGGLTRQYSLCNQPSERGRYQIAVLNVIDSRGGSREMHSAVNVGDMLDISEPKNHFPLAVDAERSLLLAGGIGVTPILAMAEHLAASGAPFEMHYCTRGRERTAFFARIANASFAEHVSFHFDDGADTQRLDLQDVLERQPAGTHLYVCGPTGFMDAVLGRARAMGWSEARLHYEFFSGKVLPLGGDAPFDVRIESSGITVHVPEDKTVIQALAEAGIEVPTSCEQGVCGTCLTRVLSGIPDHRDLFLTPDEHALNDQFTPCCSRSKSAELVLDL